MQPIRQRQSWEVHSLPVPRSRSLGVERLLLALIVQRGDYPANWSALARLFHSSRASTKAWAATLEDAGLVKADDGRLTLIGDAFDKWEADQARQLAEVGIPYCRDMLPWRAMRRYPRSINVRPLTPRMLLASAVLVGEACARRPGVRLDDERARIAGVGISTLRESRRRLKDMNLIGTKTIRVGLHKTVCQVTWAKDAAAGRPIGDDRADELAKRSLRGRLGGDNADAQLYRADPQAYLEAKAQKQAEEPSREQRTEPSPDQRLSERSFGTSPDQAPAGGGGSVPEKESSRQKLEKVLAQAGVRDDDRRTAAVDALLEKRPDDAVRWTQKQLAELKRNPKVGNPAGAFLWRVEQGQHDPANDAPPASNDHDAGQQIRNENTTLMHAQQAADPGHQNRVICSMHRGDNKHPVRIASELGVGLAQVLQVLSGAGLIDDKPQASRPAFLRSDRTTERQAATA